jgi:hypothetical protein
VDLRTLSELTLPGADGTAHRLADCWAERPVVLVFLRHFG